MRNKTKLFSVFMCFLFVLFTGMGCGEEDSIHPTQDKDSDFSYSFGIHPSSQDQYAYAKDLGIDFNREGIYFVWDWVDVDRTGSLTFKSAFASPSHNNQERKISYDNERQNLLNSEGIALMSNVCPFMRDQGEFQSEQEKETYQAFVEKLVERYDGDSDLGCTQTNGIDCYNLGDNEYPDQELITIVRNNPIKYWQVCNQVTDACNSPDCQFNDLSAKRYAEVMELTYTGIKSACPDCQVIIAGDSGKDLYPPAYNLLAGEYIDIVDKHFFGQQGGYIDIPRVMDYLKDSLEDAGFDLDRLRFWITEIGTYSGEPVDDRDFPYQTEKDQASELIKRYAVSFGYGIEKVLWAWGIEEGFGCECCQFDYTGLVYDGNTERQICDKDDLYDRGAGVKKLAYYTFKLMTQKLSGFTSVETIRDSDTTFVYKFLKSNGPIYIAWSENGETVTLTGINADSVKLTTAVPNYEYGDQVTDFESAFVSKIGNVDNGNIAIGLDGNPIFVEANPASLSK